MEHNMKASKMNRVTDVTGQFDNGVTRVRVRGHEGIPKGPDTSVTHRADQGPQPVRRMVRKFPDPSETEAIKRYGWRDQGVLVVSVNDHRLSWPERELVRQIGSKLYGRIPGEDRR
jgi:hypothetical protein